MLLKDKADYDSEQASTFDKGADDDCGHPVMAGLLRLACTCLKGSLTDSSITDCGSQSSQSRTDGLSESPEGQPCLK